MDLCLSKSESVFVKKWSCVWPKVDLCLSKRESVFVKKWSCICQKVELCLVKSGAVFLRNALEHEIVHEEGDFISICNMLDLKTFNKFS